MRRLGKEPPFLPAATLFLRMQKKIKKLLKNRLISGSVVLFAGGIIANFGNYLFNLLMGRFLGPENYAVLASLTSLLYIGGVPSATIVLTAAKLASSSKAKNELDKVKVFLLKASQVFYLVGFFVFLLFVVAQRNFAQFLKIGDSSLFVFLGGIFFFIFLTAVNNGLLQGFQKFLFLSVNSILGVLIKLGLGAVLVLKGFGVGGALMGFLLSSFLPYVFSFYPLRFLFFIKDKKSKGRAFFKRIFSFAAPTFVSVLGLVLLYTIDIVLVKHFFPAFEAGLYSAVSLAGKVIVFASSPIISVMFPLISESYTKKEDFKRLFSLALLLILGISLSITFVYLLSPRFVIWFFFGKKFLEASYLLSRFAIFILLYAFCSAFVNFFLSIQKTQIAFLPIIASLFQMIGIFLFHQSLIQVINISVMSSSLLLVSCLIFYKKTR